MESSHKSILTSYILIWCKKNLCLFVFFLAFYVEQVYSQSSDEIKAAETKSFNLNPDNLKALQNSVNLLTGQVAFPMNVAALPGKGNLSISVNIQYNSSGVKKSAKTINKYAPTSIVII
jgi:hypothetical protein